MPEGLTISPDRVTAITWGWSGLTSFKAVSISSATRIWPKRVLATFSNPALIWTWSSSRLGDAMLSDTVTLKRASASMGMKPLRPAWVAWRYWMASWPSCWFLTMIYWSASPKTASTATWYLGAASMISAVIPNTSEEKPWRVWPSFSLGVVGLDWSISFFWVFHARIMALTPSLYQS